MAITLIAHSKANAVSGTATTPAVDTTGATLLVVVSSFYFGPSVTPTISDSKGNTWTALTRSNLGNEHSIIYYASNPTVGAGHTFSTNDGGNTTFPMIFAVAFSGVATTTPFDVQSVGNSSGATVQPGSVTPSQANSLVVTGVCDIAGGLPTISGGGGYSVTDATNATLQGGLAYQVQTTATATNPTWASNAGASNMASGIAVFKASGGAPPAGPLFQPPALNGISTGGPFFSNPIG